MVSEVSHALSSALPDMPELAIEPLELDIALWS
jgi:hypothetical protein